jgi:hypothetical protein
MSVSMPFFENVYGLFLLKFIMGKKDNLFNYLMFNLNRDERENFRHTKLFNDNLSKTNFLKKMELNSHILRKNNRYDYIEKKRDIYYINISDDEVFLFLFIDFFYCLSIAER